MAAPTMVYVDPAGAADSGTGTIGDPYLDLQYALNTQTRDATNGDQFNIKAGTDEILAAALSLATYGIPTIAAPIIFRGYTSAANDGGIGGISGNGSVGIKVITSDDFMYWVDLHLHNTGSNTIVAVDDNCLFLNCEFNNAATGISLDAANAVIRCHFHDISGNGILSNNTFNHIESCYFENDGTRDFTNAITVLTSGIIRNNIIKIDGTSNGITNSAAGVQILHNSIYSAGGTGKGINLTTSGGRSVVLNNIVEGFSGSGGIGLSVAAGHDLYVYGNNKFYNNATNTSISGDTLIDLLNNSVLSASPFASPSTDNFMVDTSVKAGAYPTSFKGSITNQFLDVGAAQRMEFTARARSLLGLG